MTSFRVYVIGEQDGGANEKDQASERASERGRHVRYNKRVTCASVTTKD